MPTPGPADDRGGVNWRRLLRNRRLVCWAMYDWANSAYTTLLITVLIAYIQRVVFPPDQWNQTGAVVWAWGISLSMLLGAVLSPLVGALADASGNKRLLLAATAGTGAIASVLLGLIPPERYVAVVGLFVLANLSLELSLGIYNGFLPEVVDRHEINAASSLGFGLGYLGGGIALLLAMLLLWLGEHLGLESTQQRLQAGLVLMGCWWGLFTLPAVIVLRDPPVPARRRPSVRQSLREAGGDVMTSIREMRSRRPLAFFLLAFLFYNDGIQTVISQSSTFALQELQFSEANLMAVILMIQFVAFPVAMITGHCADRFEKKPTLLVTLLIWCSVLLAALAIDSQLGFWIMAVAIALVLGGTQSVSRSLMADLIPAGRNAQYYGFFNLSGKATSFVGTFLFGAIVAVSGSSRLAVFGLLPLFALGILFLTRVSLSPASRSASQPTPSTADCPSDSVDQQ